MTTQAIGGGVFTITHFLTPQECQELITRSEKLVYEAAAIQTEHGAELHREVRNNDRIIFDDPALAADFFKRAQSSLPAQFDGWQLAGFNERWRFYRYHPAQHFAWHQDGTVRLSDALESCLTFLIYLNDDFEGGSTEFGWESIQPQQGMALVFPHRLKHQGAQVSRGVKYVLRSDVLYAQPTNYSISE